MLNLQLISTIVGFFIGLGVLIAGGGYAYSQFKIGGAKYKDDLISTLESALEAERKKSQDMQHQINIMQGEIGKLKGLHESNEKRIEDYKSILQGRSPEQKKFMDYLTHVASRSEKYMKDTADIFEEVKVFMGLINGELAKMNVERKETKQMTKEIRNHVGGGEKK